LALRWLRRPGHTNLPQFATLAYLKALAASGVEVIEGHFVERIKRAKLKGSGELVQVVLMEEKGSDVNLGPDLVHDACTGRWILRWS